MGTLIKIGQSSYRLGFPLALGLILIGCETPPHSKKRNESFTSPEPVHTKRKKRPKDGLVQYKRADSTILSEINYQNYKKHGLAIGYYRNGNKHTEMTYEQGIKHGLAKIYYENGKLYRETNYSYGINHGLRKLYRYSGKLMSEVPFHQGHAGMGLKEYNLSGQLKTIYPELIVEGFDSTKVNNRYVVHAYFEDRSDKAEFYMGALIEEKYLHQSLKPLESNHGKVALTYHINKGTKVSTNINIIGVHTTRLKNARVVQKSFTLSADNQ